jgi:WD40 repeat protein
VRDSKKACVQTLRGHDGSVNGLAVHQRLLLSCSTDRTIKVWHMDEGRELLLYPWYTLHETVHDSDSWLNAISLHVMGESGELFVADGNGGISVYQLAIRGRQVSLKRWQQHPAVHGLGISQMLLVHHENLLLTLSYDQTARALNVSSGQPMMTINNQNRVRFTGMDWHSPTRQLFLVDELGECAVWSIHAEKCLKQERLLAPGAPGACPPYGFLSVSTHADELLGTDAAGCHVWQVVRELGYTEVPGHTGPVIALHSAEGARESEGMLYSASLDNTIKAWDSYDMSCVSTLHEVHSEISCLFFSPTNGFLISGNDDGSIRLWNPDSGSTINLLEHTNTVCCLDVAVRGRTELLLSAGFDGHVAVWDITKRRYSMPQIETVFKAHAPYEILALKHNPMNQTIVTAGNDCYIRVWSLYTYELQATLEGHTDSVTALALDGNFLLSGSEDCTVRVWDTHSNTVRALLLSQSQGSRSSGQALSRGARAGQVFSAHRPRGLLSRALPCSAYPVSHLPCLPLLSHLPSHQPFPLCSPCLTLLPYPPVQLLQTIRAHSKAVEQLLIVPDTGFLVTCSTDHRLRVWHYGEQRLIKEWQHPEAIRSLGLLRKRRQIVCGTEQANIVLFPLDEVRARLAGAGVLGKRAPSPKRNGIPPPIYIAVD